MQSSFPLGFIVAKSSTMTICHAVRHEPLRLRQALQVDKITPTPGRAPEIILNYFHHDAEDFFQRRPSPCNAGNLQLRGIAQLQCRRAGRCCPRNNSYYSHCASSKYVLIIKYARRDLRHRQRASVGVSWVSHLFASTSHPLFLLHSPLQSPIGFRGKFTARSAAQR